MGNNKDNDLQNTCKASTDLWRGIMATINQERKKLITYIQEFLISILNHSEIPNRMLYFLEVLYMMTYYCCTHSPCAMKIASHMSRRYVICICITCITFIASLKLIIEVSSCFYWDSFQVFLPLTEKNASQQKKMYISLTQLLILTVHYKLLSQGYL